MRVRARQVVVAYVAICLFCRAASQAAEGAPAAGPPAPATELGPRAEPQAPGRAALEHARSSANMSNSSSAVVEGPAPIAEHDPALPAVSCADGPCVTLGAALLAAVEGPPCRSLFVNGKCPAGCAAAIADVTGNETWPRCANACGNDVVAGAAERWAALCGVRQESLIDQGKEAVKSVLGEGLSSRLHVRAVLHFFLAVMILVLGVGYGYRRGAISAQYAYRLQKRRLLTRKSSDSKLPL